MKSQGMLPSGFLLQDEYLSEKKDMPLVQW